MSNETNVAAALDEASAWVGQVPGVVAVGEGAEKGEPTVDVWINGPPQSLPAALHGVAVRVHQSGGPIEAQGEPSD